MRQNKHILQSKKVFNPPESVWKIVVVSNKYSKRVEHIRNDLKRNYEHIWNILNTSLGRIPNRATFWGG